MVDAMNVVGSRPDGWWRDPDAAVERLLARISAHASATGDEMTVVLDRARPPRAPAAPGVRVVAAGRAGRDAADDEIVGLVGECSSPGTVTVVTSDAGLARRVRALGARVAGAGEFRRRLEEV
jgi:uncharacterized protein YaiI (UPF0178 family)